MNFGDVIKAGTFVLLTDGSYSQYGVSGLYRAKEDIVIPGVAHAPDLTLRPDIDKLAALLESVPYVEVWSGCN